MGKLAYWVVSVGASVGTGYTEIPNISSVAFSCGRTQPTDDFQSANATITGFNPDALPALAKEIGSVVVLDLISSVDHSTRYARYFLQIKNLSRTYGTKPSMDTWSISAVGWITKMTEQQLTSDYSTTAGRGTLLEAKTILDLYSIPNAISNVGQSLVSGTTYTKGTYVSDIVQELVRTEQGRIVDCVVGSMTLYSRSDNVISSPFQTWADVPGWGGGEYISIEFLNDGNYLANTVVIEPEGLAAVSNGTSRPVLGFNTLDQTTAQATDLAQYIKNTLNLNTVRPYSITYIYDAQNSPYYYPAKPGWEVWVILRGVQYKCIVEGFSVTGSPSYTEVTLQLSSAEAYSFLRLDNETLGTLDNNKLGF